MMQTLLSKVREGSVDEAIHALQAMSQELLLHTAPPDGHDLVFLAVVRKPGKGPSEDRNCVKILEVLRNLGHPALKEEKSNRCDWNHQTPLFYAARDGRLQTLTFLLPFYSLGVVDTQGQTAAFYAAREGRLDVLRFCAEKGMDLNVRDKNSQTALFYACDKCHVECIRFLVEFANVDASVRDTFRRCARNYLPDKPHTQSLIETLRLSEQVHKCIPRTLDKKRKLTNSPLWTSTSKDLLKVLYSMNRIGDLSSLKKQMDQGEFHNYDEFFQKLKSMISKNSETLELYLQLANACGLKHL
jgi:ankyrin repeat protein